VSGERKKSLAVAISADEDQGDVRARKDDVRVDEGARVERRKAKRRPVLPYTETRAGQNRIYQSKQIVGVKSERFAIARALGGCSDAVTAKSKTQETVFR
jgi:hypothetical protein